LSQDGIIAALVRDAERGLAVVRLKGGDPFVFGRGGEEALALLESGVTFEIVPGVSSGIAVPAAAGIPLTHRGVSSSVAFVTAHDVGDGATGASVRARLSQLARAADTVVIFMAGAELAGVRRALLGAGLPEDTPAAVIESGTLPEERIRRGTLANLESLLTIRAGGPVLVVVGRSVALGNRLSAAARARRPVSRPAAEDRSHG
jgi:siroheme synthase